MTKRILIAYDGSENADKAFDFALEFTEKYEGELYVLSVINIPEHPDDVETEAYSEKAHKFHETQFTHLKKRMPPSPIQIHFKIVNGHPTQQLLNQAEKLGVDHIIVGSTGTGFFERMLLGSVSNQVVQYANCSVTVVR